MNQKEETETIAQSAVGTPVQDPTPEIDQMRGLGKDMKEENTVRSMSRDQESDQEKDRDAPEPQVQNIEEIEISPAMGEDEVPAKRP